MKKLNSTGFVLAETLVVTVFLMMIFAMIYSNFYPLIGEYEKREVYDTVDGKYAIYWVKKMIEDGEYDISPTSAKGQNFTNYNFMRFECRDFEKSPDKRETCINLVKALEIDGCDSEGNFCEIYITKYQLGDGVNAGKWFKNTVKGDAVTNKQLLAVRENCKSTKSDSQCENEFLANCDTLYPAEVKKTDNAKCKSKANKNMFKSGFVDYIKNLPDYTYESLNNAKYRVIVSFHNLKDNNNYYSYATIEVNK